MACTGVDGPLVGVKNCMLYDCHDIYETTYHGWMIKILKLGSSSFVPSSVYIYIYIEREREDCVCAMYLLSISGWELGGVDYCRIVYEHVVHLYSLFVCNKSGFV